MQNTKIYLLLFFLIQIPSTCWAQITIANIESHPTQSDRTHEWIEITNDGNTSVSLKNWRLVVNGDRHLIKSISGTTTILSGASAIITHHPAIYESDYPSYRGLILLSSFTLPNSDGTVSLINTDEVVQASKSYIGVSKPMIVKSEKVKTESVSKRTTVKSSKSSSKKIHHTSVGAPIEASEPRGSDNSISDTVARVVAPSTDGATTLATVARAVRLKTPWWPYALGIGALFSLVIGSTFYSKKSRKMNGILLILN